MPRGRPKGYKLTEEQKEQMRISTLSSDKRFNAGVKKGYKQSPEHLAKRAEALRQHYLNKKGE